MKFNLFGIGFDVSYLSVALLCLAVLISSDGSMIIYMCIVSSILHETGHIVALSCFSCKPKHISITPSDISISCDMSLLSTGKEVLVNLSGPAINLTLSLFFGIVLPGSKVFCQFALCNLVIGLFNLLPVTGLDGGNTLHLILMNTLTYKTTQITMNIVSTIIIIPVLTAGFMILFSSRYNYSLLFVGIYMTLLLITKEMR